MNNAKPFVKWVGGKRQLMPEILQNLPDMKNIKHYVEPFLGGGAVMFELTKKYKFETVNCYDINENLILTYNTIKNNCRELLIELERLSKEFSESKDKKSYYLNIREEYNGDKIVDISRAAYFIFLNKIGFNGLYRVNSNGKFNVPFGNKTKFEYDRQNIIACSYRFQTINFICGDYSSSKQHLNENTFLYVDPPYRPISKQSFVDYDKSGFNDDSQIKLHDFLKSANCKFMMSNSDPNDNFFDDLYANFNIKRILAPRNIKPGHKKIPELLITNYETKIHNFFQL